MKRIGRTAALVVSAALAAGAAGCADRAPQRYETTFAGMFDTVTTVTAYTESREAFDALADSIRTELNEYHELYDVYHEYEGMVNLCTVNRIGREQPVKVDGRIVELLRFAKEQYAATGGKVNVALGGVLSLWSEYRERSLAEPEKAALPPMDQLQKRASDADLGAVVIDEEASTVFLGKSGLLLDVGAVAKGYAAERVAQRLEREGRSGVLLNLGGNVRAVGGKPDGSAWMVGVQNPRDSETLSMKVPMTGGALVTSGDYQRYYEVDGTRYCHIIDPDTLMPAAYVASVTVLCADSGRADALSTALFTLPLEKGRELVASLPGVEAAWIDAAGKLVTTSGWPESSR